MEYEALRAGLGCRVVVHTYTLWYTLCELDQPNLCRALNGVRIWTSIFDTVVLATIHSVAFLIFGSVREI